MMISPEGYYEMNLEGKTPEEVLEEIEALKQEIKQLEKEIEENPSESEEMCPTRATMLECCRGYLEWAIWVYESYEADEGE